MVAIALTDDYYLKIEAIGGVGLRGQYLVDVDVQDAVPPKVTSISGIPAEGGGLGLYTNPITLNFSEDVQTAGVNAASTYELRSAGADVAFGTADDVVYTLSRLGRLALGQPDASPTGRSSRAPTASPREPRGCLDRFGNPLDGDGDGTGGDDLVRTFSVAIPAGYVLESRSNDCDPGGDAAAAGGGPGGLGLPHQPDRRRRPRPGQRQRLLELRGAAGRPAGRRRGADLGRHLPAVLRLQRRRPDPGQRRQLRQLRQPVEVDQPPPTRSPPTAPTTCGWATRAARAATSSACDLGRSVQLEPYDFGQANNSTGAASALAYAAGAPGHLAASVAGSLYSGEGLDYYALGRLDPGNRVDVASRTISVSGLTYKVQVVGGTHGPDARPGRQPARRAGLSDGRTGRRLLPEGRGDLRASASAASTSSTSTPGCRPTQD